jgi:hypothetical protein
MDPEAIDKLLHASPFKPFKIQLLDGGSFEVRHPELVVLGKRSLFLAIRRRETDRFYSSFEILSYVNIGRLQPVGEEEEASDASESKA